MVPRHDCPKEKQMKGITSVQELGDCLVMDG